MDSCKFFCASPKVCSEVSRKAVVFSEKTMRKSEESWPSLGPDLKSSAPMEPQRAFLYQPVGPSLLFQIVTRPDYLQSLLHLPSSWSIYYALNIKLSIEGLLLCLLFLMFALITSTCAFRKQLLAQFNFSDRLQCLRWVSEVLL